MPPTNPWRYLPLLALVVVLMISALQLRAQDERHAPAEIAAYPGVVSQIRAVYQAQAIERDGVCPAVRMRSIAAAAPITRDGEHLVLDVEYFYEPRGLPELLRADCRAFASRTFAFRKEGSDYTLEEMSGAQRPPLDNTVAALGPGS
ncbi:MAG TPA: hypothetical protein VFG43_13420 [Geminicoccaceae bacterium]|nr:hypothetical protein [Geminicoccaceae bacterium]